MRLGKNPLTATLSHLGKRTWPRQVAGVQGGGEEEGEQVPYASEEQ